MLPAMSCSSATSIPTRIIPAPSGAGDHALLSNLAWTVSGHTGTAGSLVVFDNAGAAGELTGVSHGDIVFFDGNDWTRLAPGAAGAVLQTNGVGADPSWVLGATGITPAQHKSLLDLIHFIDNGPADGFASGAVQDTLYGTTGASGALISEQIWYTSAAKIQRIVDLTVTYTGSLPTTEVWRMYDAAGLLALTLTDAITYNGGLETSRSRTWV